MKIELDNATATTLFQALRAYIRQLAVRNATVSEKAEARKLHRLWKAARAAEVLYVAAILNAKEERDAPHESASPESDPEKL